MRTTTKMVTIVAAVAVLGVMSLAVHQSVRADSRSATPVVGQVSPEASPVTTVPVFYEASVGGYGHDCPCDGGFGGAPITIYLRKDVVDNCISPSTNYVHAQAPTPNLCTELFDEGCAKITSSTPTTEDPNPKCVWTVVACGSCEDCWNAAGWDCD